MKKKLFFFFFCLFFISITAFTNNLIKKKNGYTLTLTKQLSADDFLYTEYLDFSCDNPAVQIQNWHTPNKRSLYYDPAFKEHKEAIYGDITINLDLHTTESDIKNTHIFVTYFLKSQHKIMQSVVPISWVQQEKDSPLPLAIDTEQPVEMKPISKEAPSSNIFQRTYSSWYNKISSAVQNSDSIFLKMSLAFLLGILLSLTPCIYPMVPITAGILQSQASKSVLYNFLLSFSYTCGIATTFAILGLIAAFSGQVFGSLLVNPIVIILVVLLLAYLALSMIGIYPLYLPSFFKTNNNANKGGSLISAFLFGAASGTVASPCLSPGLILLLSIVTTLGNKILGFFLLFAFGIGLSLPLLLVGSSSSSLSILPQAGLWMNEIKKFVGFLLLGTCIYYLNNIFPWYVISWLICFFVIVSGLYYLYDVQANQKAKLLKNTLGMLLIGSSIFVAIKSYQATWTNPIIESIWEENFALALKKAQSEHKKLFVDIGAPYCSICKSIDNTLLCDKQVCCTLQKCVPVKIDGSNTKNPDTQQLCKKYNIIGFPTLLLIDPDTQTIIHAWDGNLYNTKKEEFINQLESKL